MTAMELFCSNCIVLLLLMKKVFEFFFHDSRILVIFHFLFSVPTVIQGNYSAITPYGTATANSKTFVV
jgi:hypothetical protein